MPIVPATWETEAGRSLLPRSSRAAWATYGDSHLKKKKSVQIMPVLTLIYFFVFIHILISLTVISVHCHPSKCIT
jgi:hypothetical protein